MRRRFGLAEGSFGFSNSGNEMAFSPVLDIINTKFNDIIMFKEWKATGKVLIITFDKITKKQ